ncbi:MAG: RsmB/NOP family class I SAM-dependent RNA methyltransferase, partial [Candidatus Helarchaeota archaeon]
MGAIDKEEIVAEALTAIEKGSSEREALKQMSDKYNITNIKIRGTIHSIVFEIIRRLNVIDMLIEKTLEKGPLNKLYPMLRNLLRVGVYNLKFTNNPPLKITKLTVQKTKELFGESISRFANAVLRKVEKMELSELNTNITENELLSIQYFHPSWFIEYLIKLIGRPEAIEFLKKSLEPDSTYIRINTIKIDVPTAKEKLTQENFVFQVDTKLPDVIKITSWKYPIVHSFLFKEGFIYIQDRASALVSHVLNPQMGEIVFDFCAAPGGKTMHIGQLLQNSGKVLATDRSHRRLLELTRKLSRYNLQNIVVINTIGENISEFIRLRPDKILIDPPCSGTGTFVSRPYS